MNKPRILVAGASGKTGAAVVALLRKQDWPVRAVVRRRDSRSATLERLGAEIAVADLFDPDQIAMAMRGVMRAYYCPPYDPYMIQSAVAFATAVYEARCESVVLLGQWLSSASHPSLLTRQSWLAERLFALVPGIVLTMVNPGFFADNYLRMTPYAAHLGIFPAFYGESRNAPPSNEDIARVVAAALMDPARHAGRSYRPTGPAVLSTRDMTAILGRVLSRAVTPLPMPIWMLLKAARMQGASIFEIEQFVLYMEDHRDGAFEVGAPNEDVLEATGVPAESFEQTARRYASRPEALPSAANRIRAWIDFLRTPLVPGHDIARYARGLMAPTPTAPRFSMADDHWRITHGAGGAARDAPRVASPVAWVKTSTSRVGRSP